MSPDFKVVCSDKVSWSSHFTLMHLAAVKWRYTLPSCCSKKKYSSDLPSRCLFATPAPPPSDEVCVMCLAAPTHTYTATKDWTNQFSKGSNFFLFFGLLFSATSNEETRDARSGKNKASVYLFVLYVFLFYKQHFVVIFFPFLTFSLFSSLVGSWWSHMWTKSLESI